MIALIAALLIATPSGEEVALEAAFAGMVAVDYLSTRRGTAQGLGEMNPLLGPNPSAPALRWAAAGGVATHLAVTALLPARWRRLWQIESLVLYSLVVGRNMVLIEGRL